MREDVASCAACNPAIYVRTCDPNPQPPPSHNFDQITPATRCKCATNPDPPSPNMRAGERAKMCAKIITLRNQQKCTILDPKNSNNDSFGIHSVKVLVQVHYFRVFFTFD